MEKNAIVETNHFYNSRGYKIFYQMWKPVKSPVSLVATIIHGLGEHIGRYDEMANFLTDFGIASFGIDLYGFGKSEGKRGHVFDINDYLKDIKTLYSIEGKYLGVNHKKRLILGHSMGGLLALAYLEKYPDDHNLAIISAPALRPEKKVPKALYIVASILKLFWPSLQMSNKLRPDEITSDMTEQEYLKSDGLVHDKITLKLFFELLKLSKLVWKNIHKINKDLKILFLHGEKDKIAFKEDTEEFFNLLQLKDKRLEIMKNMKHEVHTDINRKATYEIIKDWLKSVLE